MVAAFLGLRLYSVLGRRAEHEEEPVPTRFDTPDSAPVATLQPRAAQPKTHPSTLRHLPRSNPSHPSLETLKP